MYVECFKLPSYVLFVMVSMLFRQVTQLMCDAVRVCSEGKTFTFVMNSVVPNTRHSTYRNVKQPSMCVLYRCKLDTHTHKVCKGSDKLYVSIKATYKVKKCKEARLSPTFWCGSCVAFSFLINFIIHL